MIAVRLLLTGARGLSLTRIFARKFGGLQVHRLHGRKSLSRRLPLIISGLLIAALAAFAFVGYQQLTTALFTAAKGRVRNVANLLARNFESSVPQLRTELAKAAADSAVVRTVRANDASSRLAADRFLANKLSKNPQAIGAELLDKNGKRMLWTNGPAAQKAPPLRDGHVQSAPPAGMLVGPIVADRGTLYHEATVPIVSPSGDTIGRLVEFRRVSSAQGAALIAALIGSDARLLFSSPGGKWNNLETIVPGPPAAHSGSTAASYTAADGSLRFGASAAVKSTPWVLWVDIPKNSILAPARRFLGIMALAGLLILIAGTIGAWSLSRQITTPLQDLALAAKDISAGDYTRRVTVRREDELGIMAETFNEMAHEIEESRREVEGRVSARTRELETALGELREAQETLVRKEKLAMLGLLAGGVGHELRNPLGVMTNAVYYLSAVLKDAPTEVTEYLDIVATQIRLSEKIVGDLLDFARIKPPQFENVSIQQIVDEQLKRAVSVNGIKIEHDFPADLPRVRVDRVQIGQVVLNLITNAVQAMNGHGAHITFRGRPAANGFVRLDVVDTGMGMAPAEMQRLFEPLFTTKARGIGLGLAVSRSLVLANGGVISAESSPGNGTTMSVSLPTIDRDRQ
jgi:signal transduction histidine kinase